MMKKLLLACLLGTAAPLAYAQDDISAYFLQGNSFDTNFNYDAQFSGNVKGDVINDIYGWTKLSTSTYTVAGTFAYNPGVTFNGSDPLPAAGYGGSQGGALALTTGWEMTLKYGQEITLPKGKYRLAAAYYNVGSATSGSSLLAWGPASGTATASTVTSFPVKAWLADTLSFTLTQSTTGSVQIGFKALASSSAVNAKVLVDYVKLLCDEIDKSSLRTLVSRANRLYGTGEGIGAAELLPLIEEGRRVMAEDNASPLEVLEATKQLTDGMLAYQMKNASPDSPVNLTTHITNPSFENGFEGWESTGFQLQTGTVFPRRDGTTYLEKWVPIGYTVADASVTQTLEGLPNGRYKLTLGAGNIQQRSAGSTLNNGTEPQTGAWLFAGNYYVPVDTIKTKTVFFAVTDGTAKIGFKAENATGNWVACDNFQLYYIGENTLADHAAALEALVATAEKEVMPRKMQAYVRAMLTQSLDGARQLLATEGFTEGAIAEARDAINAAIAAAEASKARYDALEAELPYAYTVLGWYEDDAVKAAKMKDAIAAATAVLGSEDLTDEQLSEATAALTVAYKSVDKKVYTAYWSMGNVNDPNNNWSLTRTRQSKNWILFWEKDYGENPSKFVCGNYTVDIDAILQHAETAFKFYTDSLKFLTPATSKTNTYKMVIRLRYSPTDWEATGSGVDDRIGLLTLTPWASNSRNWQTLYHEIGHCFQYQTHCDNNDQNGWMYPIGTGCAFWEQCAQWQAYKIMPADQFSNEWFYGYLSNTHKHILHESPRYNNFFVHDYWTYRHGMDFIGRLWNESKSPEDAVQAYMRITGTSIKAFNDEMYDCAARFATWDLPALASYGSTHHEDRPQPEMVDEGDDYWRISAANCPENTGHNIIRLNAPSSAKTVSAFFEGMVNADGYRVKNSFAAGWRYGFVALLGNGKRIYSDMAQASYAKRQDTLHFECPDNCRLLYFVVTGAPTYYWQHAWDDDDSNDEQWPYRVKFNNTNKYGSQDVTAVTEAGSDADMTCRLVGNTLHVKARSGSVTVISAAGQTLFRSAVSGEMTRTLPQGLYSVKISADGKTVVRKLLVE